MIENPILRGFNPDPAICRVGEDYYIVTSTFEWFPGYQIHHSKDLVNWQLVRRPLDRVSQLDMRGEPDSCGVWAPCLTHHDGVFYLLYTNVRSFQGMWKDMPNYLVTATDIMGEWSEPVYLNSSGFDASLFHDDDGKCYLVNMLMDHRRNRFFGGIVLQEYDRETQQLMGDVHHIFEGTEHDRTEGPHLYKRNGWYYLLVAEGGTGYDHCMTVARSRSITGPYEVHPENPMVTSKYEPEAYLQKTGHGGFVETQNGEWYTSFLTSRPLSTRGRCILGRESGLERLQWCDDDWPRLAHGGQVARQHVEAPDLPEHPFASAPERTAFDTDEIDLQFQAPRIPLTEDWVNQSSRRGFMRISGRESLSSCFDQSLVARRVQAHHSEASTCVEFEPETFQQMAGLVCYYNTLHYHYLHVYGDDFGRRAKGEPVRKFINIFSSTSTGTSEAYETGIDITGRERIYLKADFNGAALQFYYGFDEGEWEPIGPVLDGSILSDDFVEQGGTQDFYPCFTGAFYGMCCQDLSGDGLHADFAWFEYREYE
jgi:xylan 1,4-beta-xylosidase